MRLVVVEGNKRMWCDEYDEALCTEVFEVFADVVSEETHALCVFALCKSCALEKGIDLEKFKAVQEKQDEQDEQERLNQENAP